MQIGMSAVHGEVVAEQQHWDWSTSVLMKNCFVLREVAAEGVMVQALILS